MASKNVAGAENTRQSICLEEEERGQETKDATELVCRQDHTCPARSRFLGRETTTSAELNRVLTLKNGR